MENAGKPSGGHLAWSSLLSVFLCPRPVLLVFYYSPPTSPLLSHFVSKSILLVVGAFPRDARGV